MYIFLIIWLIFLLAYIIFNAYGLFRIIAIRFQGDAVGLMVLVYIIAMFTIIFLSIFFISHLDWSKNFLEIFSTKG